MRLKKFKHFYTDHECSMYSEDIIFFLVSLYSQQKIRTNFELLAKQS